MIQKCEGNQASQTTPTDVLNTMAAHVRETLCNSAVSHRMHYSCAPHATIWWLML